MNTYNNFTVEETNLALMVGYDEKNVYVHDNSKIGVQTIPVDDLRLAWANDYIGISKRNAYFGIDMKSPKGIAMSHFYLRAVLLNKKLSKKFLSNHRTGTP